jgi:prepilin-type N-terminal cleavage/methylation domain-containing protein
MRATAHEDGFTLIEVLVTIALALVVFGATLGAFNVFQHDEVYARQRNETQDAARNTINRLSRQLRNVIAPSVEYPGALETAKPYALTFQTVDTSSTYSFGSNSQRAMRVRYCLGSVKSGNEALWEQTQEWNKEPTAPKEHSETNCPEQTVQPSKESSKACEIKGEPTGGWTSTRCVVEHVTNEISEQERPVFTYSSSELPQIVTVTSDLYLDVNPGHRPGESQLSSSVSLRNANRLPVAKFKITSEAGFSNYRLNASESYDPGGLALTYRWWEQEEGGTEKELSTTSQISQVKLEKSKTKYTFKLQVTNPGGLSETAKETVTTP